MSTVVVDTNVLASGFVRHRQTSPPVQIVDAWRARSYTLILSEHILTELTHTFEDPYFEQKARLVIGNNPPSRMWDPAGVE